MTGTHRGKVRRAVGQVFHAQAILAAALTGWTDHEDHLTELLWIEASLVELQKVTIQARVAVSDAVARLRADRETADLEAAEAGFREGSP